MKYSILALAISSLLAASAARAEVFIADSTVVSLPAFVVEATRIDLPKADITLSLDASLRAATTIADRTSDRALGRLKARLTGSGRQYVRHPSAGSRPRA